MNGHEFEVPAISCNSAYAGSTELPDELASATRSSEPGCDKYRTIFMKFMREKHLECIELIRHINTQI
jgi:hypothetical protein